MPATHETDPARVKLGDLFTGWGKTWRVIRIKNGTAKAENVNDPFNTITLPLTQYREMRRAS